MNSTLTVGRVGVAGVWLHEGLWCKVLGRNASHMKIVAGVPGLRQHAVAATRIIGLLEVGLAAWILAGHLPRSAAIVQSGALIAMNAGGLRWARPEISRPAALLGRNALFLALVWLTALSKSRR